MIHKVTAFVILALCLAPRGSAAVPVSLGLQGGINFANASMEDPTLSLPTTTRTGLIVGAIVEIGLSEVAQLQTGISYIQRGAKVEVSLLGQTITSTGKADYIRFPALLKARFGQTDFKPYIFAGPVLGLNVNAEVELSDGTQSLAIDVKDMTESTEISLDFGAGGEYGVNQTTSLFVDIRYSYGLTDIDKTSAIWKNKGTQISAGVKFSL